ncbi:MAG: B12-binding domain-containing radical SAM protein [Desulfosoma sp.]
MKVLLVYPEVAETFWSFRHALRIVRRKAAFPPLGLLTVAALLPEHWEKRVVDMNTRRLNDQDILWADYVFVSAMIAQRRSTKEVVRRCSALGVPVAGGGPLFYGYADEFTDVAHVVIGEGEKIVPELVADLEAGRARRLYRTDEHPDLDQTPLPSWDLIRLKDYASMCVQYSRGCPFNCEFCDIIVLNGRKPRTKSPEQMIDELEALYSRKWRGSVFIVDDNFIGNKHRVKNVLEHIIRWQERRGWKFSFYTEASVDLAEDMELMELMVRAGFNKVFLGLETPATESLKECGKGQNLRRPLDESVRIIQENGLAVMGGFIIGFDNDPPDIFQKQVHFVQSTGVVTAMIGLLTAVPETRLYKRLEREGRLLFRPNGDNTSIEGTLNFIPKMDRQKIVEGYRWVMDTIYSPHMYYERIKAFLESYRPQAKAALEKNDFVTFLRSLWYLGIRDSKDARACFWKILKETFLHYRSSLTDVVTVLVYGYHFRKLFHSGMFRNMEAQDSQS